MKQKKLKIEEMTDNDLMKFEIAQELGLMDKVKKKGWKSLTAREAGKIGGLMTKKKRQEKKENLTIDIEVEFKKE